MLQEPDRNDNGRTRSVSRRGLIGALAGAVAGAAIPVSAHADAIAYHLTPGEARIIDSLRTYDEVSMLNAVRSIVDLAVNLRASGVVKTPQKGASL